MPDVRLFVADRWDAAAPAWVLERYQIQWNHDDPTLRAHFRWLQQRAAGRPFWFCGDLLDSQTAAALVARWDAEEAADYTPPRCAAADFVRVPPTAPQQPPGWRGWRKAPPPLPEMSPDDVADVRVRRILPAWYLRTMAAAQQAAAAVAADAAAYQLQPWYVRRLNAYLRTTGQPQPRLSLQGDDMKTTTKKSRKAADAPVKLDAAAVLRRYWEDPAAEDDVLLAYVLASAAVPELTFADFVERVHAHFGTGTPSVTLSDYEADDFSGALLMCVEHMHDNGGQPADFFAALAATDAEDAADFSDAPAAPKPAATKPQLGRRVGDIVKFVPPGGRKRSEGVVVAVAADAATLTIKMPDGKHYRDVPAADALYCGMATVDAPLQPDVKRLTLNAAELATAAKYLRLTRQAVEGDPQLLIEWRVPLTAGRQAVFGVQDSAKGPYVDAFVETIPDDPQSYGDLVCGLEPRRELLGNYLFDCGDAQYVVEVVTRD